MNSSRKHWTLTALLLTSVFAWALSGCGTSGSKQPAAGDAAAPAQGAGQTSEAKTTLEPKLRIGYISPNNKGTITGVEGWAQKKKATWNPNSKKYGVTDVSVKSFPNGPNLNEALASGALDVGIYGDTPAINARAVGLKTKLINITQSGMNAWLVAKADGPQKVEDLKGKKNRYSRWLLHEPLPERIAAGKRLG